jgi:hypothetical protein
MTISLRNLDYLRSAKPTDPGYGTRLYETISDLMKATGTIEQQGNFDASGTPAPPPNPDNLSVVPHPQGVQFAITHNSDFYQGINYEIDAKAGNVTHTYDVGTSRNGVLPVGTLKASYQVRARYPNGASTNPVVALGEVTGGSGKSDLLPSQGAGTTKAGQPPGFGGPFRGSKPPSRGPK